MIKRSCLEKGQVVIEAAVVSLLLLLTSTLMTCLFYFFYLSFWADHTLAEANICVAEGASIPYCEGRANRLLSKQLFLSPNRFKLSVRKDSRQIHSHLKLNILGSFKNSKTESSVSKMFTFQKVLRI